MTDDHDSAPEQLRMPGAPDADTVRAIEAIIMVAVEPVPAELLAQLLEQPTVMIERLCAELASAYAARRASAEERKRFTAGSLGCPARARRTGSSRARIRAH